MHLKSTLGLMALSVGLVAAAPAGAQPGHHHDREAGGYHCGAGAARTVYGSNNGS